MVSRHYGIRWICGRLQGVMKNDSTNKKWATFKTLFAREYHDNREKINLTTSKSGYYIVHSVVDISIALHNLAMATMADWNIVKNGQDLTPT